jgi:hypothetical protein
MQSFPKPFFTQLVGLLGWAIKLMQGFCRYAGHHQNILIQACAQSGIYCVSVQAVRVIHTLDFMATESAVFNLLGH